MGRVYYPLYHTKGSYKEPPTAFLSVAVTDSILEYAYLFDGAVLRGFNQARELVKFIAGLDHKTWVITYGLDWINPLIYDLLDFFSISGYGLQTRLITLTNDDKEIYIIDCWSFFADNLLTVLKKSGLDYTGLSHGEHIEPREYSRRRVMSIFELWNKYRESMRRVYGVHPSKTPGATALKSFRPFLDQNTPIKARGRPVSELSKQSQTGGALHWRPGIYHESWAYDINAAYPFVMTVANFPRRLYAFSNKPPPSPRWIATVRLDYRARLGFSPLALRLADGAIVHPTAASGVMATINNIDYLTLAACGDINILDWLEGVTWFPKDESPLFRAWGEATEKALTENPELKPLLKITSRALHSKFSQAGDCPIVEIKRIGPGFIKANREHIAEVYPLPDGGLAAKLITPKPKKFECYYRPDLESLILSLARFMLYSAIDQNTIYADTDCLISTAPRPDLTTGPGWGCWKLAGQGQSIIIGPRIYSINDHAKISGLKPVDNRDLRVALWAAANGQIAKVEAMQTPGIGNPFSQGESFDHKIKIIPYPHVTARGGYAYITTSPTRRVKLLGAKRIITI